MTLLLYNYYITSALQSRPAGAWECNQIQNLLWVLSMNIFTNPLKFVYFMNLLETKIINIKSKIRYLKYTPQKPMSTVGS